jgi:hypothetical protein
VIPQDEPREVEMFVALLSIPPELGTRGTGAMLGGGISVLVGMVTLALLVALAGSPSAGRRWWPRPFLALGSALLVLVGGAFLLVGGIVKMDASLRTQARRLDALKQTAQVQLSCETRIIKAQSEQLIRTILNEPERRDPKRLNRYEYKVSSQNGEDGIIAEIFRRIGTTNRYLVEFGAANGAENNTALLVRQGWGGLWMDADPVLIADAGQRYRAEIEAGRLTVLETFITAENIEDLFRQGKVPEEIDLLSIDIDRNDYYVWEKITHYRPRVVVIEYNAGAPPTMSWVVPYDAKGFGFNSFGTGNGASLKALEELGNRKGYSLVGCDLCGVNAFFVRDDLLGDHFAAPYTAANHYEPFRYPFITH